MWAPSLSGHKIRPWSSMNHFSWYWFRYRAAFSWPPIWMFPLLFTHIENESTFLPPRNLFFGVQSPKGHLPFRFNKVTVENIKSQRKWNEQISPKHSSKISSWTTAGQLQSRAVKSPFKTRSWQAPPSLASLKTVKYDFSSFTVNA